MAKQRLAGTEAASFNGPAIRGGGRATSSIAPPAAAAGGSYARPGSARPGTSGGGGGGGGGASGKPRWKAQVRLRCAALPRRRRCCPVKLDVVRVLPFPVLPTQSEELRAAMANMRQVNAALARGEDIRNIPVQYSGPDPSYKQCEGRPRSVLSVLPRRFRCAAAHTGTRDLALRARRPALRPALQPEGR